MPGRSCVGELKAPDKPFDISKRAVWEAYEKVRANKGAPGVDKVSLAEFEKDLKNNLYKIWNRMSSGTYFPPPVRAVEIPKPHGGGTRVLGVPTVADRIAQGLLGDRRSRTGWAQLERSMRPLAVVMRGVLGQHPAEVPLPKISIRSVSSVRTVLTRRSAKQFARGQRGGILTTSIPASASTASNEAANCPARSRTRNRNRPTCSPRSMTRLRAC